MIKGDRVRVVGRKLVALPTFGEGRTGTVVSAAGSSVIVALDPGLVTTVADNGSEIVFKAAGEDVCFPDDYLEVISADDQR